MQATGELVAGQELDALVTEKVMGWDHQIESWYDEEGLEVEVWVDDKGGRYTHGGGADTSDLPEYSTDIAAAWRVVGHLAARMPNEFMLWQEHGQWGAEFQSGTTAFAKTAPLAICHAALKAVET